MRDRKRSLTARPNADFGGTHVVNGVREGFHRSRTSVQGIVFTGISQVLRGETVIMINLDSNGRRPFLDIGVGIDGPNFVNGLLYIPSARVALGDNNHVAGTKVMSSSVGVAQRAMSLQDIKDFGDSFAVR